MYSAKLIDRLGFEKRLCLRDHTPRIEIPVHRPVAIYRPEAEYEYLPIDTVTFEYAGREKDGTWIFREVERDDYQTTKLKKDLKEARTALKHIKSMSNYALEETK